MHDKTEVHIDNSNNEKNNARPKNTDENKPGQRLRKPATYRSVGIRIPGNDSLMVVHVKEY